MRAERIRSLIATTEQATEQAEAERTRRILEFCRTPRSREEIQTLLGLKDREYFRKDILEPLIASGKLELTEPDKPTSPKQRYKTKDSAL
jgi:ATP-dependent DNA helicase RecG